MKKQLLLGSALLAAISAFPQASQSDPQSNRVADRLNSKYTKMINHVEAPSEVATPVTTPISNPNKSSKKSATTNNIEWVSLSTSMNAYGVSSDDNKPLQYDDALDAVSFIHRKPVTYTPNPVVTP